MSRLRQKYYRLVEGEVSGLMDAAGIIDFELGGRVVCVESTSVTATLRDGERLRVLLQEPREDAFFHVLAFQRASDSRIHYTGARLGLHVTVIGSALIAAGLYSGHAYLLVSGASLFLLELLLSLEQMDVVRRFYPD